MRKTLLALCASILAFGSMYAVPAKPGKPLTFTQSDGTKIQVSMVGDEFRHSFVTTDGITVAQAENGDFYYRTPAGISDRLAHNATDRSASEASWIASQAEALSISATPSKAKKKSRCSKKSTSALHWQPKNSYPARAIHRQEDEQHQGGFRNHLFKKCQECEAIFRRPIERQILSSIRPLRHLHPLQQPRHLRRQRLQRQRQGCG